MKNLLLITIASIFQICTAQNISDIEKKALEGNANAQFKIAEHYKNNLSDKKTAFKWAMKSAKQGHEKAQLMVGDFYAYEPEVVKKNIEVAIDWYQKSAKQKSCEAFSSLGWIYSEEFEDDKHIQVAIDWFNKGIDLGCITCMEELGSTYLSNTKFKNRLKNGLKWLEKAANLDQAYAQYYLGGVYSDPKFYSKDLDIKVNLNKAIFWYEKAALNEDVLSIYLLAYLFDDKKNTEVYDKKKANYWFEIAAKLGDDTCQYEAGVNLIDGDGIEKNIEKGLKYLRESGYSKNYYAQSTLGLIYCLGLNVKKDTRVGWFWFDKLIDNNEPGAKGAIIDVAEYYLETNTDLAIQLYIKSANNGHSTAQNNLGVIYINDKVVPRDLEKAKYWLHMALENNDKMAKENLKIIEYLEKNN